MSLGKQRECGVMSPIVFFFTNYAALLCFLSFCVSTLHVHCSRTVETHHLPERRIRVLLLTVHLSPTHQNRSPRDVPGNEALRRCPGSDLRGVSFEVAFKIVLKNAF